MEQGFKKFSSYVLVKELGKGMFGTVYLAYCENEKQYFAIKCISNESVKNESQLRNLKRELKMLYSLKNDNIIRIFKIVKSTNNFNIVLDYANGGTLTEAYNRASNGKTSGRPFSFEATHLITKQLVNGLYYMNTKKAVHRDLKMDNILLHYKHVRITDFKSVKKIEFSEDKLPYLSVKIADLGFTRELDEEDMTNTICGTPLTMAPEVINVSNGSGQLYSNKIDMWSLGVIFYQMTLGKYPFEAKSRNELYEKVKTGDYTIDLSKMKYIEEVMFCESLLKTDPAMRMSCKETHSHPFLTKSVEQMVELSDLLKEFLCEEGQIMSLSTKQFNIKLEICKQNYKNEGELEKFMDDMKVARLSRNDLEEELRSRMEKSMLCLTVKENVEESDQVDKKKELIINYDYFDTEETDESLWEIIDG